MSELLFELPLRSADRAASSAALSHKGQQWDYATLGALIDRFAVGALSLDIGKLERIAIFLPKQLEAVVAMFGAARAGCVFVPVNPLLKPAQVGHILRDCNVGALVTSPERAAALASEMQDSVGLRHLILVGGAPAADAQTVAALSGARIAVHAWDPLLACGDSVGAHRVIDTDVVSIFYTSGSTGRPKGVVLSHRNMVTGADSVSRYLGNTPQDRLLAVLPLSFDYGFSQLSTAFRTGASVVLMEYLLARDVLVQLERERITGLAGVPPLWTQLADLPWPAAITEHLRYMTNSGGTLPRASLAKLRRAAPKTRVFLMYGLTEAFRSTYLDPAELDRRPDSMGKAIPNAEILVVRPDGNLCDADEPGELVHRGSLVGLGYWNDPQKTSERFKPAPGQDPGLVLPEMAVWSGDTVRRDADGFLYFVGRRDEMIKTSGYRVSPTEIEEVVFATGLVADAVAVGVAHPKLGQVIVIIATAAPGKPAKTVELLAACRQALPLFMVPQHVEWRDVLPRNPNGKYDRPKLVDELKNLFAEAL